MIDYDFIEIGTSDFDTIIESCSDTDIGLCVEPLVDYLNNLPSKNNVKKINCAISFDDSFGEIEIFYIPVETLKENKLPLGLRGCNRINEFHPHHITRGITHLVKTHTPHPS